VPPWCDCVAGWTGYVTMNPDMAPVTLYVNGRILTMVPGAPVAAAPAVRDGRLAAVGDGEGVLALRGRDTEVVDLAGRTVLPGFVERLWREPARLPVV